MSIAQGPRGVGELPSIDRSAACNTATGGARVLWELEAAIAAGEAWEKRARRLLDRRSAMHLEIHFFLTRIVYLRLVAYGALPFWMSTSANSYLFSKKEECVTREYDHHKFVP